MWGHRVTRQLFPQLETRSLPTDGDPPRQSRPRPRGRRRALRKRRAGARCAAPPGQARSRRGVSREDAGEAAIAGAGSCSGGRARPGLGYLGLRAESGGRGRAPAGGGSPAANKEGSAPAQRRPLPSVPPAPAARATPRRAGPDPPPLAFQSGGGAGRGGSCSLCRAAGQAAGRAGGSRSAEPARPRHRARACPAARPAAIFPHAPLVNGPPGPSGECRRAGGRAAEGPGAAGGEGPGPVPGRADRAERRGSGCGRSAVRWALPGGLTDSGAPLARSRPPPRPVHGVRARPCCSGPDAGPCRGEHHPGCRRGYARPPPSLCCGGAGGPGQPGAVLPGPRPRAGEGCARGLCPASGAASLERRPLCGPARRWCRADIPLMLILARRCIIKQCGCFEAFRKQKWISCGIAHEEKEKKKKR